MEPEGSLPHLQEPAIGPYSQSAQSNPNLHIPLPEDPSSSAVIALFKHTLITMTHLIQDRKFGVIRFFPRTSCLLALISNKTGIVAK